MATTVTPASPLKLSTPQVRVLHALKNADSDGMSMEAITRRVSVSGPNVGPSRPGAPAERNSLVHLGLVRVHWLDIDGRDRAHYSLTAAGREAATLYRARGKDTGPTVPVTDLDRAVNEIRPSRTYGFEVYTEFDLSAVREHLPDDYQNVPLESLRQQIICRRKSGDYSNGTVWPEWYTRYRRGHHFGTLTKRMAPRGCAVNGDHEEGVAVYHRSFLSIGAEEPEDVVLLCAKCFKRCRNALPRPAKNPPPLLPLP